MVPTIADTTKLNPTPSIYPRARGWRLGPDSYSSEIRNAAAAAKGEKIDANSSKAPSSEK